MRLANRALAALLSLAVACAGVLVVIEVIADRAGQNTAVINWHSAYEWVARTTWNADAIRVAAGILIVAGLVLLIAELKPPRASRLAAESSQAGAAGIQTAYTRRGVAAAVRSAVADVDGVGGVSVKVTRRKVTVAATAATPDKAAARTLREPVTAAGRRSLAALRLRHPSALSVRIEPGSH
jgi:hypothetical protein